MMKKEAYSMKDLKENTGHSDAFFRKMENLGHLNFKAEKVRGQIKRLFNQGDYNNAIHIAGLSRAGYGPKKLEGYKSLIRNFKERIRPFLKKLFKDPDDLFFVFHSRDVFPDGDPDNLDWEKLGTEEGDRYLYPLKALYTEALMLKRDSNSIQMTLEMVNKNLDIFVNELEKGLGRTLAGQTFLLNIKALKDKINTG